MMERQAPPDGVTSAVGRAIVLLYAFTNERDDVVIMPEAAAP
jgi:hypothetical protein